MCNVINQGMFTTTGTSMGGASTLMSSAINVNDGDSNVDDADSNVAEGGHQRYRLRQQR
jgi:hypothetical protein